MHNLDYVNFTKLNLTFKSITSPSNGLYAVCITSWKLSFSISNNSYDKRISPIISRLESFLILATKSVIDIRNSSVLHVK